MPVLHESDALISITPFGGVVELVPCGRIGDSGVPAKRLVNAR
jgi:hypothetical protein